ncbi:MAG: HAMP domain-containing histidine kinase [Eubacterium sp.]|nr:HAMP domain-containing histidine kinase [Eubacterium sp.]
MKKHYILFGSIYCVAIAALFSTLMYLYSKSKVDEVNMFYKNSFAQQFWAYENPDVFNDTSAESDAQDSSAESDAQDSSAVSNDVTSEIDMGACISEFYSNQMYSYNDAYGAGYYNAIISLDDDYRVVAESRDFIYVRKYGDGMYESKIAFPIGKLKDPETKYYYEYSGFDDTMVDGAFIYNGQGEMSSYDERFELVLERPWYINEKNGQSFADWAKNSELEFRPEIYNNNAGNEKNNLKAKAQLNQYLDKYKSGEAGEGYLLEETGFFTSRYVYFVKYKKIMMMTYSAFCKPFSIALKQNKKFYTYALLLFMLIEAATIFSIRRLYLNQKSFEIRSQRLTRGIAHELKTPLAVTKACVENWEYIDEKDRPEYSKKINAEVDHMAGMITKLLELSKLNGGKDQVNREDIDLLKLTQKVYSEMRELAKEKKLDVSISGYDDDKDKEYIINADPEMMHIVVSNFISNAIKYSESYIKIALSDLGKKIEFRITNDGATIEKKDIPKVWDVFYRTNEARNDRITSSGVGLAVVKSILDLHKAKYGCESNVHNTTFYFIIEKAKEN